MRSISPYFYLSLFLALLTACGNQNDRNCTQTIVQKRERIEYFSAEEMRSTPIIKGPQALKQPGKIFWLDQYIFLTEGQGGIHIIDNTNASKLEPIAFIQIEGNWDVAAKGQYLYADSYADLLVFDLSNPLAPQMVQRINNTWNWDEVISRFKAAGREEELIKDRYTETYEHRIPCGADIAINSAVMRTSNGQAGSLARFNISGEYLYAIDYKNLHIFNLRTPEKPIKTGTQFVDEKIETIFAYGDRLFLGGQLGVYIYDKTDPLHPQYLDQFKHLESCDPVYVDQNYAYVTLREDASCRNAENKLLVLDIKDFSDSKLVAEYPMQHPHGLSVKEDKLYLAEGKYGFKVFDLKDKQAIDQQLITQDSSLWAKDLIAHHYYDLLLVVGKYGLYQYDIKNPAAPKRLQQWNAFE